MIGDPQGFRETPPQVLLERTSGIHQPSEHCCAMRPVQVGYGLVRKAVDVRLAQERTLLRCEGTERDLKGMPKLCARDAFHRRDFGPVGRVRNSEQGTLVGLFGWAKTALVERETERDCADEGKKVAPPRVERKFGPLPHEQSHPKLLADFVAIGGTEPDPLQDSVGLLNVLALENAKRFRIVRKASCGEP